METAYAKALDTNEKSFDLDGTTYYIINNGKNSSIALAKEISMASKMMFSAYTPDIDLSYDFRFAAERL